MDEYEELIAQITRELGAPPPPSARIFREAAELVSVGQDIYGRDQRLTPPTAEAWTEMRLAA